MSKGYAEGPALEEKLADAERAKRGGSSKPVDQRLAVFGATTAKPASHFIGWADEVDADQLFDTGKAYGIKLRRVPV
jgi:hypothetical protein